MNPATAPESEPFAPLISIVIPVYDIEDYLDQCLDSITDQDFEDFEIIAVDGGSTDGSAGILKARAEHDRRLVVETRPRIGPGKARNIGMDLARGKYVWFVDGDDLVGTGCLRAIVRRLERDEPDVLFIGHVLRHPDGHQTPGYDDHLMRRAPRSWFSLAEQPWVIDLSVVCWNKIINRELLRSTGLRFADEWPHEEIPLSCLLLLSATRLSALDLTCYEYRVLRRESVMLSGAPRRHFAIFAAFGTVLDQAAKMLANHDPRISEQLYCAFFKRAIRHFTSIYEAGTGRWDHASSRLLAPADRREFFGRMHFEYLRYKPAGYKPGFAPLEVKLRLIEAGSSRLYESLLPLNRFRVEVHRRLTRQAAS